MPKLRHVLYLPPPRFSDDQWAQLYNSEYFSVQSAWLIKQRSKEFKSRFDRAENFLNRKKNLQFLDIGTGEGNSLIQGSSRNWDVTGIDIVDNRIESAKTGNIKFYKAKFSEHPFPGNHFDFIYLDSVLEHVLNPVEYLEEINHILKPGGILYIGVPNEDSLFNDVRKLAFWVTGQKNLSEKIRPFESPYHVVGFNEHSLKYIFSRSGLEIKYFRNFGRKFDFLSSPLYKKSFWMSLFFLFPVEIAGYLLKRDVYFEAFLMK